MVKAGQPFKFKTVKELEDRINQYFADCDNNEKPYTVTGLALALDTNRQTLSNYEKAEGYEKFFDTIKKAKARVENYAEETLYRNGSVTGVIFNLKNNFGWQDKHESQFLGADGKPSDPPGVSVKFVSTDTDT